MPSYMSSVARSGRGRRAVAGSPPRRRLAATSIVGAAILLGCAISTFGQTPLPPTADPATTAPAEATPSPARISLEQVQETIRRLEEMTDLDPATRDKLIEQYRLAADQLRKAEETTSKAAAHDSVREKAPETLAALTARKRELEGQLARSDLGVPDNAPLGVLEERLGAAQQELKSAQQDVTFWENEPKRRQTELPKQRAAAEQRLKEIDAELAQLPELDDLANPNRARRRLLEATRLAIEAELALLDKERARYEATLAQDPVQLDIARLRVRLAEAQIKKLTELVNAARAQMAAEQEREAKWAVATAFPELQDLAARNQQLTQEQSGPDGLLTQYEQAQSLETKITNELADLRSEYTRVKGIVDETSGAGLNESVGLYLQRQRAELPSVRHHRQQIRLRQEQVSQLAARLIAWEDERAELTTIEPVVAELEDRLPADVSQDRREDFRQEAGELLEKKREYLTTLVANAKRLYQLLLDININEGALIVEVDDYEHFISEHVLWIQSAQALSIADVERVGDTVRWLVDGERWRGVAQALWYDFVAHPLLYLGAAMLFGAWILAQRPLRRLITSIDDRVAKEYSAEIRPTIEVLALTIAISTVWPALLAFVAWRLAAPIEAGEFAQSVAFALRVGAAVYLPIELARQVCRKKGLGQAHFRWPTPSLDVVRRNLRWLLILWMPLAIVNALIDSTDDQRYEASLGRLSFMAGMIALAGIMRRILHPQRGIFGDVSAQQSASWWIRLERLWQLLGVGGPLSLALVAALGYYYTAIELAWRLQATLWLVLTLVLVDALFLRWLLVARRKLAIKQARDRRAAMLAQAQQTAASGGEAPPAPAVDEQIDLVSVDVQTRRLLRSAVGIAAIVGAWLIWVDVLPALSVLDKVDAWEYEVEVSDTISGEGGGEATVVRNTVKRWITLKDLIVAGAVILMTFVAGRNIPGLLEISILQRLPFDPGGRYAITTVTRYIIALMGLLFAFKSIGIGWSNVQWLAAAITVGLGFGLQEIFANFVSGLIILFERPMRVGDTVTIGAVSGTVSRIRIRATTIIDWDRKELIVPNRDFITGQLVNWTLTDNTLRLVVPIGVAYGTDTALATKLLQEIARANERVLTEPEPVVVFYSFGDSALNFELRVFIGGLEHVLRTRHQLNMAIERQFREHRIEIAFPQRDIHIRSIDAPLPVVDRAEVRAAAHEDNGQ